jgi:hypothetical protein
MNETPSIRNQRFRVTASCHRFSIELLLPLIAPVSAGLAAAAQGDGIDSAIIEEQNDSAVNAPRNFRKRNARPQKPCLAFV